jgi:hypothetical protein
MTDASCEETSQTPQWPDMLSEYETFLCRLGRYDVSVEVYAGGSPRMFVTDGTTYWRAALSTRSLTLTQDQHTTLAAIVALWET